MGIIRNVTEGIEPRFDPDYYKKKVVILEGRTPEEVQRILEEWHTRRDEVEACLLEANITGLDQLVLEIPEELQIRDESEMLMPLCEFNRVVLQPDRRYRPIFHPGCKTCEDIARQQVLAYGRRSPTYEELQ